MTQMSKRGQQSVRRAARVTDGETEAREDEQWQKYGPVFRAFSPTAEPHMKREWTYRLPTSSPVHAKPLRGLFLYY